MVFIYKASHNEPASLLSLTPNLNLLFLFMGKDSFKKFISSSGALPVVVLLIIYNATFDDSNG